MKPDLDTKKFLLMGGAGLVACVFIFAYAFSQLFNRPPIVEKSAEVPGELVFDESKFSGGTSSNEFGEEDTSCRQPVSEFTYEETEIYQFEEKIPDTPEGQTSVENVSTTSSYVTPNQVSEISTVNIAQPEIKLLDYPSLGSVKWKKCGTLTVPTGLALATFSFTAGSDPAVECMGEAVAKRCASSQLEVVNEGEIVGSMYVLERSDDVCSVGVPAGDGLISLCSVEKIMNAGAGEEKSFKQWQAVFKTEPGDTFASMYFDNSSALSNPASASIFDCRTYKF